MDTNGFSASTTVEQVLKANPRLGGVFTAHGIDTCCGGGATLAEAAARGGMTLDALLGALGSEPAARTADAACGCPAGHAAPAATAATPTPMPAAAADAVSFAPFFSWSLGFALTFGATLGSLMLAAMALPSRNFLGGLSFLAVRAAHAYAQVFGFAALFIMGVAYHTMPRYKSTALAAPQLAAKTFWLQAGGVLVVTVGMLVGPPLSVPMWLAGTLSMLGAALAFWSIVHRTLGATPPLPEGFEPYLRAGCVWLVVASGLSVGSVAAAAGVGIGLQPAVWAAGLWGFAGCWLLGMSLRVLPVFMGLPHPRERRSLFYLYQGGVLLWVTSALVENWTPLPALRVAAGGALALAVVMFVFRLGIFGPREVPSGPGQRDYEKFIVTAYVWLLAAVVFEPGWSASAAAMGAAAAAPVFDLGRHAFTLGFLTQMIVGVATRIVPVITGKAMWSARCTRATYYLLNAAVVTRGLQAVVGIGGSEALVPYVALSGPLGMAAFGAFAANVIMTTRQRQETAATPAAGSSADDGLADKVLADLLAIPGALEVLAEGGLHRLRDVAARMGLARAVTLRQACRMHGLAVEPLVTALSALPRQGHPPEPGHAARPSGAVTEMALRRDRGQSHVRTRIELAMPVQLAPIVVRDPFLEFLGLVDSGEPIAVGFEELVKAAGHLCPTVAGAYLVLKHGLAALYGDEPAVRGQVRVTAYGRPQDFGYGPIAQLVNLAIGAAPETGFGGLGPGRFARRNLFVFKSDDIRRHEFDFERLDTGRTVHVVYDPACVPTPADFQGAIAPALIESATAEAVARFRSAWLGRVHEILSADGRTVRIGASQVQ
ncbi:MAG: DUF542 domain-containing protein [Candidatus Binatia bacterium]